VTRLLFSRNADVDLEEIWHYVAQDSLAAADRVLDRIGESIGQLLDFPKSGHACPDIAPDLRRVISGNYVIYYRIKSKPKTVLVVRVLHGARGAEQLVFDD
jgi:toxin ParE1/3/4